MILNYFKNQHSKILYIFLLLLSLNIFFFSTVKSKAESFNINNINISREFEINFNKNDVIDEGFQEGFLQLISLIVNSNDLKKIQKVKLNEIKGMIESFTIKEEKFIDEVYYLNLGVSFNKKKIFTYLEKKNIFPSLPNKKKFLFIPIIIEENSKDLLIFNNNEFFSNWNNYSEKSHLIDYILPTEDLEDLNFIKKKYELIEKYDFKEITKKYSLDNSIIALIFKDKKEIRILSRITIRDDTVLKNQTFENFDIENDENLEKLIKKLKTIYEDYWKDFNQINTSIKLTIYIKIDNNDNIKIAEFENTLDKTEFVYDFFISKFNKDYTYYQIVFNSTPNIFLKIMKDNNYTFNTQNKIWILE